MISLQGDKELSRLLKRLPLAVNKKAINGTARKAGRHVVSEARKNTNEVTGNLKRSIGIGSIKSKDKSSSGVWIGARRGGDNKRFKGYHAHLYAYGHKGRGANKGKGNWIGEAADAVEGKVMNELKSEFGKRLDDAITKYSKRF